MNKRFNSVPRLKIATSLSIDNNNLQSPIYHTPRRLNTEIDKSTQLYKQHDQWKSQQLIKYIKYKIIDKSVNKSILEVFIIHNFKVYKYYIPQYNKIENENELISDFIEIQIHLKQLLKLKSLPKIWNLQGLLLKNFNQQHIKILYISTIFNFWNIVQSYNQFSGQFQLIYLDKIIQDIQQLQNEEEIYLYFFSNTSQIKQYFSEYCNILPQIYTQSIKLDDHEIDTAFSLLGKEKQKVKVETFEHLNKEFNSKSTYQPNKLIQFRLRTKTRQSIEKQILQETITDPEQLQQQIQTYVENSNIFIPSYKEIPQTEVLSPFQLKINSDRSFIKNVNIDKIQMDFKITRRQTISFLTIFKCLLNREQQPYKMKISKANLLLAYPYLLMEGQSCGYETFHFMKETKMSKFTFEEFLKIFLNGRL